MKFLHAMVRVQDLEKSLNFYMNLLGFKELRRKDSETGRFTLIFLGLEDNQPIVELTYNWDQTEKYPAGRNFGHLAFSVKDIYHFCEDLHKNGVQILRPPRDGRMAFVCSPDQISIEILQEGEALEPKEPWISMPNCGAW
ncbi:MAG: lactoylglutathione lyase [bacterium]|jgi:lactoylglutathione lyase